jgi:hypothetical protein
MQTLPSLSVSVLNGQACDHLLFFTYYNQVSQSEMGISLRACLSKDLAKGFKYLIDGSPRVPPLGLESNLLNTENLKLSTEFSEEYGELFVVTAGNGVKLKFLRSIAYPEGQQSVWELALPEVPLMLNSEGNKALTSIYWDYIHLKSQ